MTKQQLEEKIKNKESVWFIDFRNEISKITNKEYRENCGHLSNQLDKIFSTKAEAEHYLKNSDVTRIEKLPYITWKEFKKKPYFNFLNYNWELVEIEKSKNGRIYIRNIDQDYLITDFDFDEENFYKAYKVAKDLFLGGKNE